MAANQWGINIEEKRIVFETDECGMSKGERIRLHESMFMDGQLKDVMNLYVDYIDVTV